LGLPQFAAGVAFGRAVAGYLAMHHGTEFVMNQRATMRNLPLLQALNAGGRSGGGVTHYHTWQINALDGPSFDRFLKTGGASKILHAVRSEIRDGH
jgi:hypothetical protein